MADTRTRDLSMMPFALSTPQNAAGGGVSAEYSEPAAAQSAAELLAPEKNNSPYLVLRAGRAGERACAERALRSGLARDAFSLARVALRREHGAWVARTEAIWPGYVLVEPAEGIIADDLGAVGSLTPIESALVRRLGGASHLIPVSEGRIVAGRLEVRFGPLAGLEPLVRRVDRHRRLAWLEPEPGRRIPVGLEVVSKS